MKTFLKICCVTALFTVFTHRASRCIANLLAKKILRAYLDAIEEGATVSITLKKQ